MATSVKVLSGYEYSAQIEDYPIERQISNILHQSGLEVDFLITDKREDLAWMTMVGREFSINFADEDLIYKLSGVHTYFAMEDVVYCKLQFGECPLAIDINYRAIESMIRKILRETK